MTDSFKAKHWSEVDRGEWDKLAPNFSPKELASKGDESIVVVKNALKSLQRMRDIYGKPLRINSAYRDKAYNVKIGGSPNSQHLLGTAFDIHINDKKMGRELEAIAIEVGAGGIGRYNTFIHVDFRPKKADGSYAQWGEW